MRCVKVLIILAVITLRFSVMAMGERSDQLMCELKTVVGPDALDGKSELYKVIEYVNEELRGEIGVM